jgi:predicted SnoaL-like aldol condensation-catalyzing enzyme
VAAHPDPLSLLSDKDPSLAANKRLVFDMWRSIVNAGHVELADDMLQEGYIQHSPVLPTGRAGFKTIFSAVERRGIPELVAPPLVTIIAEGDLVVMALSEDFPEPGGEGRYATTHFNLFRVEGGRLAEHWHSVQAAPGPNLPPAAEGGPQPVTGISGAAQTQLLQAADRRLAANKRLVFDAWRRTIDAGREDMVDLYFAKDFVDHDPNAGAGREAFRSQVAARADAPVRTALRAPIVAIVAQGDLVTLVTRLEHPHPARKGQVYTTTWFDMFRIEGGRIAEHWNGATKPGAPPERYGNE